MCHTHNKIIKLKIVILCRIRKFSDISSQINSLSSVEQMTWVYDVVTNRVSLTYSIQIHDTGQNHQY